MEEKDELKLEDSCKTIILKQHTIFLSAYPGKIVFGESTQTGYQHLKYFQFNHFQILELYIAIVNILKYLVSDNNPECEKGLILKISVNQVYFWLCKRIHLNNIESKVVKIAIEYGSECVYEITFNFEQLNYLINGISTSILPCLCLKNIERQFFSYASEETSSEIIKLMNFENCHKLLNNFEIKNNIKIEKIIQRNMIDNLIYYNETILLLHKFNSLKNAEQLSENQRRIESILKV